MKANYDSHGNITGWDIPEAKISIHKHVNYSGFWVFTCRRIGIVDCILCTNDETNEREIARYLFYSITQIRNHMPEILNAVNKHTV